MKPAVKNTPVQECVVGATSTGFSQEVVENVVSDISELSSFSYVKSNRCSGNSLLRNVVRQALEISTAKLGIIEAVLAVVSLNIAKNFGLYTELESVVYYGVAIAAFLSTAVVGLNERRNYINISKLTSAQFLCCGITLLGLVVFSNLFLFYSIGRRILLMFFLIYAASSFLPKLALYMLACKTSVKLLWVGSQESAASFNRMLARHGRHYILVGYWNGDMPTGAGEDNLDYMLSLYRSLDVDQIVLSKDTKELGSVLDCCYKAAQAGCIIVDETTFMEDAFEQVPVENINENWFFQSRITVNGHLQSFSKRALDVIISFIALTLGGPAMLVIWTLIRLSDRSSKSVIFTQMRMGQFGVPFKMYKFRTMTVGTENKKGWTQKRDIRITKIGHFLRRTRLDELPQFWNVLKGDMSVVGPRPEIPELVKVIERDVPYFSFRCWSRPGITGMAQIRYRYCSDISDAREKLKYDLFYIKNWSLLMDVQIMLRTITALMHGSR